MVCVFFFQAEDGIRDWSVTGVQTCALPICRIVERRWQEVAEVDVQPSPAHIPARRRQVLGGRIEKVAVWIEVVVAVGPVSLREIGRASCRERVEVSWVAGAVRGEGRSTVVR